MRVDIRSQLQKADSVIMEKTGKCKKASLEGFTQYQFRQTASVPNATKFKRQVMNACTHTTQQQTDKSILYGQTQQRLYV